MRRRQLLALLGVGAAAWPLSARAEQSQRVRRIGALIGFASADEARPYTVAFEKKLQTLGWTPGETVQIDYRLTAGDNNRMRSYARELVALSPDVLLASGTGSLAALQQLTHTIPIVFIQVTDPVTGGFVTSLSNPGGNITGITNPEIAIVGERLRLVKEIAPGATRVMALFEPGYPTVPGSLHELELAAGSLGMQLIPAGVREGQIEQLIREFARDPNGSLAVIQSPPLSAQRVRIVSLATEHRLPGVYANRSFVTSGGLASLGTDLPVIYDQVASYLDRILKGEKPSDVPVQQPAKAALVLNLQTAKKIGVEIPPTVIARATEVIE